MNNKKKTLHNQLELHPLANVFPPMLSREYRALVNDIKLRGQKLSIKLYDGKILDGKSRYWACIELGIEPKCEDLPADIIPLHYVISSNHRRRHLTKSQIAAIACETMIYEKEHAETIPAKGKKDTSKNLPEDRQKVAGAGDLRDRIAKEFGVNHKYINDAMFVKTHDPISYQAIFAGKEKNVARVRREIEQQLKKREQAEKAKGVVVPSNIKLNLGDCWKLSKTLKDKSIKCIITDPPYDCNSIDSYDVLGKIAQRVLEPGGFCIVYAGKLYLPQAIAVLQQYLEYYWQFCIRFKGCHNPVHPRSVWGCYRPVLVFAKPPFKKTKNYIADVIEGGGRQKDAHPWQQAEDELRPFIEHFTEPRDLVLDPFAGSGTVLKVCHDMDRHAIGFEIDENAFNSIKIRLHHTNTNISENQNKAA